VYRFRTSVRHANKNRRCDTIRRVPSIATIGVYDFDAARFEEALKGADVSLVVDVRQRRAVRGPQYSWANARRLQALLAHAGVAYSHHRELAPTTELRHLQYREDDRQRVGKRNREHLAPEYVERYTREILDRAPLQALVDELPRDHRGALMCVESSAAACHRSLIAQRLAERYGVDVVHLEPS
jgi:uncharacterized protein (DUF488 family)